MIEIIFGIHNIEYFIKKKANSIKSSYSSLSKKEINKNLKIKLIFEKLKKLNIPIYIVNKKYLNKLFNNYKNYNICIKVESNISYCFNINKLIYEIKKKKSLFLILENINDPRNLGSCIRTADAAGIKIILITKEKSSPINEIVNLTSSGSLNNISIMRFNDIKFILKLFKKFNIKIVSTSDKCDNILYNFDLKFPIVFIFGSEKDGITNITKKYSDLIIKIPMYGYVNSLNVSVSLGICLFESIRQTKFNN